MKNYIKKIEIKLKKINIENFRFNYPIYSSIFDIKSVSLINMLELVCNILRNYTFHNKVIPIHLSSNSELYSFLEFLN
jgi:hypothetical protein